MKDRRVRLSPEARRAQLIELGVQMLSSRTLDELSVEALAAEAGISRGLLFHYFRSKQEFRLEVARAAAHEMLDSTQPDESLEPMAQLRGTIAAFIDHISENPEGYVALVRGAASGDADLREVFDSTRAVMAQRVIERVESNGVELDDRGKVALHGWIAYCEEVVIRWLAGAAFTREDLINMLAGAVPALMLTVGVDASAAIG